MKVSEIIINNFGLEINDGEVSDKKTWSSKKIQEEFTKTEASSHSHANKEELDKITSGKTEEWDNKAEKSHTHNSSDIEDLFKVENSLESNSETNAISVAQAKIISDKIDSLQESNHSHENKTELDKIVDGKVEEWDSKANGTHTHNAADITEDASHRFVTDEEKEKWNNSTEISDESTSGTSTWSSQKISEELKKATPTDYEDLKRTVEQNKQDIQSVKAEVETSRKNIIQEFNSIVDIM